MIRRLSAGFSRGWPQAIAQRREAPERAAAERSGLDTYYGLIRQLRVWLTVMSVHQVR